MMLLRGMLSKQSFRNLSEREKWQALIITLLIFAFLGMIVRRNTETGSSYDYLLGSPTATLDASLDASTQPTPASQSTLTPAQENYERGMEELRALVNGGTLAVEGQRAVQHFRRATQQDPMMAAALRNYGLLMYEFWRISPYESNWRQARAALHDYQELAGADDPDVIAALDHLENPEEP